MENKGMEADEYELDHFGFTAKQLSLERKRLIRSIVNRNVNDVISALSVSQETKDFVQDAAKGSLVTDILELFQPFLKEFEELDTQHFSIEPHVLLPNDFALSKEYSEAQEQKLDDEMIALKQEFLQNSMMLALLKSEAAQYDSIKDFIEDETIVQQNVHKLIEELDKDHLETTNRMAKVLKPDS